MTSKTTALVLASLLAAPFIIADNGMAKGKGKDDANASFAAPTETELEAETRDEAIGAKLESEFESKNKRAKTQQKFKVEFEFRVPVDASGVTDQTKIQITVNPSSATPALCTFTRPGRLERTRKNQAVQKVEFEGVIESTASSGGAATLKEKGLDCGDSIPVVVAGDTIRIDSSLTSPAVSLTATFAEDD